MKQHRKKQHTNRNASIKKTRCGGNSYKKAYQEKPQKNAKKYKIQHRNRKWECRQCPQRYEKQSMGNAIQNACKHKQQNEEQNNPTWKEWEKEQKHIRDCRIRTLIKWKPPEMDTSSNTSQEEGKTNKQHTPEKHNAQEETHKTRQKQRKKHTMTTSQLQTKPKKNHYGGELGYIRKIPTINKNKQGKQIPETKNKQ